MPNDFKVITTDGSTDYEQGEFQVDAGGNLATKRADGGGDLYAIGYWRHIIIKRPKTPEELDSRLAAVKDLRK